MKNLSEIGPGDVGWVSGFLEGEGCFNLFNDRGTVRTRIAVTNTDYESILKLKNILGRGNISSKCKKYKPQHKDKWIWTVSGNQAKEIMSLIYTHMSQRRRDKIDLIMQTVHILYPRSEESRDRYIQAALRREEAKRESMSNLQ